MAEILRIRYVPVAVDDLDYIFSYISEDNRSAALKLADRLDKTIQKLADNPRLGAVLTDPGSSGEERRYRTLFVKPYIIFYQVGEEDVYISRVLHFRQEWLNLIFDHDLDKPYD